MPETIEVTEPVAAPVGDLVPLVQEPVVPVSVEGLQATTHDVTAEASSAAGELQGLLGKQEGSAGLLVAVLAVLFGAGGWKFYSQRSREAHDLKLREMELKANQPTVSPPQCIAKHNEIEARIAAAEGKAQAASASVDEMRAKSSRVAPLVVQVEELEERVTVIETSTKRASAKGKKA
jgi:uncharacterized protein YdcH (DUF465 family)